MAAKTLDTMGCPATLELSETLDVVGWGAVRFTDCEKTLDMMGCGYWIRTRDPDSR